MDYLLAKSSVSITELKKNPSSIIDAAEGAPIAILKNNRPSAYLVPAVTFEAMLEKLDDLKIAKIVKDRKQERSIRVSLNEL
ncbi:MAG: type II toxin-antitoxin system prevent-host-death family antitoxin [Deltaproteobacteria bacterium]|nr:type II toxin-antitoxin system prevent-host-death family antitoxin [Deltaproteobacteria bacterium]